MTYFYNDPENGGIHYCDTEASAREGAEHALDLAREIACEYGWEDSVELICWGVVSAAAVETGRKAAPEGSDFDEIVTYELKAEAGK